MFVPIQAAGGRDAGDGLSDGAAALRRDILRADGARRADRGRRPRARAARGRRGGCADATDRSSRLAQGDYPVLTNLDWLSGCN